MQLNPYQSPQIAPEPISPDWPERLRWVWQGLRRLLYVVLIALTIAGVLMYAWGIVLGRNQDDFTSRNIGRMFETDGVLLSGGAGMLWAIVRKIDLEVTKHWGTKKV